VWLTVFPRSLSSGVVIADFCYGHWTTSGLVVWSQGHGQVFRQSQIATPVATLSTGRIGATILWPGMPTCLVIIMGNLTDLGLTFTLPALGITSSASWTGEEGNQDWHTQCSNTRKFIHVWYHLQMWEKVQFRAKRQIWLIFGHR